MVAPFTNEELPVLIKPEPESPVARKDPRPLSDIQRRIEMVEQENTQPPARRLYF